MERPIASSALKQDPLKNEGELAQAQFESTRDHASKLISENRQMIELLQAYSSGKLQELDVSLLVGPIAISLQETKYTDIRERLLRWSTFFSQNIDDVVAFSCAIETGLLTDPFAMLDVLTITEDLLAAAYTALEGSKSS